ncbi:MAG: DUF4410 domain-containing protein [Proteobacteria bacterium]|nr:DUF4410 domain-containing protein [Pseudomonadota bacterium]
MKKLQILLLAFLAVTFFSACGGGGSERVTLREGVSGDIAVLSLGADTSGLNGDQVALLNQTLNWMDRDIIQALKRTGLQPKRIQSEGEFTRNGYLLKITITDHKMIPKGARFMAGMMAGADVLSAHYDLVDRNGQIVLAWDDTQASTKGGTYCAKTLNRNAAQKIADHLG